MSSFENVYLGLTAIFNWFINLFIATEFLKISICIVDINLFLTLNYFFLFCELFHHSVDFFLCFTETF
jgi:hypothetical protein